MKGKGQMETFFVLGRKINRESSLTKSQSAIKNSMTEVISGMVEVRRKQALSSTLSVPSSRSFRKSNAQSGLSLAVPSLDDQDSTKTEFRYKRNTKISASFRFRKSPSPHHLHRMMSEMSNIGRSRSFYQRKYAKNESETNS